MKIQKLKLLYNKYYPDNYPLIKYAKSVSRRGNTEFVHMQYPGKTTLQVMGNETVECYEGTKVIRQFLRGLEKTILFSRSK